MRDGGHVFDVVVQPHELVEAEHREHFYRRFLLSDERCFGLFKSGGPREFEDFRNQFCRQALPAIIRMHQHADASDVPFPAAEPLVQCRHAGNLAVHHAHQRQVPSVINVPAPIADDLDILHAMLDEHALRFGNALKQLVEFPSRRRISTAARSPSCRS